MRNTCLSSLSVGVIGLGLATSLLSPTLITAAEETWIPFEPKTDTFTESAIDLRHLNEAQAGEHGFIATRNGEFIHSNNGASLRFWAVNGPPHNLKGEELRRCARMLAKRGVNMVRIHGGVFDGNGEVDSKKIQHAFEIVEAMKAEGIYSHFSIYFPLWLKPKPGNTWLPGYDGNANPFATLLFNKDFQAKYQQWWTALLTTTNSATGKRLVDEPAVAGVEMQNEDSFFFWTFAENRIPDPQLKILEKMFGDWLLKKHGSLEAAFARWNNVGLKRDVPDEGRVAFRPLYTIFSERKERDRDTAEFLFATQAGFYNTTRDFLRRLGFKGVITASNWTTASPDVLGPIEKLTYSLTGDFVDRHGYFSCNHKGQNAEWSIRDGHTYVDRSALRFDGEAPGKGKLFSHPGMDVHYDDRPSMISETTWNRPNRYRSEAPLYFAVFGALQDTDAIVHFALDGIDWAVKPNFWMQPWTLMSPSMMGQFPAAALIHRRGLIKTGDLVVKVGLNTNDVLRLGGTPLPQDAALDELRLKDIPSGAAGKDATRLTPLAHFVGKTQVTFGDSTQRETRLERFIDTKTQQITSATEEIKLDYAKGLLTFNAPGAQGVSGALGSVPRVETDLFSFESSLDLVHMIAVPLDGQELAKSSKILVQVMSEEQTSGFKAETSPEGLKRILSIGKDPWQVKSLSGRVKCKRPDAARIKVVTLDHNGYPGEDIGTATSFSLRPGTLYYVLQSP